MSLHKLANNATTYATAVRGLGGTSLEVQDASVFSAAGYPIYLSVWRRAGIGWTKVTVLEATAESDNTFTISGAGDNEPDAAVAVGDLIVNSIVSAYIEELQDAITAGEADLSDAVILAPTDSARNVIQGSGNHTLLTVQAYVSASTPPFAVPKKTGATGVQIDGTGRIYAQGGLFAGSFSAAGELAFSSGVTVGCSSFSKVIAQGLFECQATSETAGGAWVRAWQNDGLAIDATHRLARYSFGAYDGSAVAEGAHIAAYAATTWSGSDHSTNIRIATAQAGTTLTDRLRVTDRPLLVMPTSAIADGSLNAAELSFHLSSSDLAAKYKDAGGTAYTIVVASQSYVTAAIAALSSVYAAIVHTHDDRYYTESEVDTLLSGKAATSHTHSATDITSGTLSTDRFSAYDDLTAESRIGTGAAQVAAGDHNHDAAYAAIVHNHDSRYPNRYGFGFGGTIATGISPAKHVVEFASTAYEIGVIVDAGTCSVKFQYSSDGSSWSDVGTVTLSSGDMTTAVVSVSLAAGDRLRADLLSFSGCAGIASYVRAVRT